MFLELLTLALSVLSIVSANTTCTQSRCTIPDRSLRFLAIGDFGGLSVWPWNTYAQRTVAHSLQTVALERKTHFQLALGDNFYLIGVQNENDSKFHKVFESVYTGNALRTPWYVLAGNHDHYGNVTGEIAYTSRSSRWVFPSLYYGVQYGLHDGVSVDLVLIDTVVLCGNTKDLEYATLFEYLTAPESAGPLGPKNLTAAETQWKWIENRLQSSRAGYLFVMGHYPVYSGSYHGPTACLKKRLKPLLERFNVSAYISGHDHNLQHIKHRGVNYVVSGSGAFLDDDFLNITALPEKSLQFRYPKVSSLLGHWGFGSGGFAFVEAEKSRAVVQFYDGHGNKLYDFRMTPRVNRA